MTAENPWGRAWTNDTFIGIVARSGGLDPRLGAAQRGRRPGDPRDAGRRVHAEELRPSCRPRSRQALERGVVLGQGRAHRMTVEAFLDEISQREGDATRRRTRRAARPGRVRGAGEGRAAATRRSATRRRRCRRTTRRCWTPTPAARCWAVLAARAGRCRGRGSAHGDRRPGGRAGPLEPRGSTLGPLTAGEFAGLVAERAQPRAGPGRGRHRGGPRRPIALRMPRGADRRGLRAYVPAAPAPAPANAAPSAGRGGARRTRPGRPARRGRGARWVPRRPATTLVAHAGRCCRFAARRHGNRASSATASPTCRRTNDPVVPRLTAPGPRVR